MTHTLLEPRTGTPGSAAGAAAQRACVSQCLRRSWCLQREVGHVHTMGWVCKCVCVQNHMPGGGVQGMIDARDALGKQGASGSCMCPHTKHSCHLCVQHAGHAVDGPSGLGLELRCRYIWAQLLLAGCGGRTWPCSRASLLACSGNYGLLCKKHDGGELQAGGAYVRDVRPRWSWPLSSRVQRVPPDFTNTQAGTEGSRSGRHTPFLVRFTDLTRDELLQVPLEQRAKQQWVVVADPQAL